MEGYEWRANRQNELMSYFTYWIVAPHCKRNSVTPQKIAKPLQPQKKAEIAEEDKNYFADLAKRLGGE